MLPAYECSLPVDQLEEKLFAILRGLHDFSNILISLYGLVSSQFLPKILLCFISHLPYWIFPTLWSSIYYSSVVGDFHLLCTFCTDITYAGLRLVWMYKGVPNGILLVSIERVSFNEFQCDFLYAAYWLV